MTSPLLDHAPYGAYVLLLGLLVKFLYRRIRPWIRTREEMAQNKAKARRQTASFLAALVFVCAVAFALLVLLAVILPQTSPRTPIILLLAGADGALGVMGALLLVFGLPAYNYVIDLEERYQNLEDQYRSLASHNQNLGYRWHSLADRYQKLEDRMKAVESQIQANARLEEQFPQQGKLAFMDMWQLQKREHDTDLMKSARIDVGRLAGSQR